MNTQRLAEIASDILHQQRDCLKSGDIAGAAARNPKLERLIAGLGSLPPDARSVDAIATLRAQADRNARLILAAREGIARARRILDRDRADGFVGYDAQGRQHAIGRPARK